MNDSGQRVVAARRWTEKARLHPKNGLEGTGDQVSWPPPASLLRRVVLGPERVSQRRRKPLQGLFCIIVY